MCLGASQEHARVLSSGGELGVVARCLNCQMMLPRLFTLRESELLSYFPDSMVNSCLFIGALIIIRIYFNIKDLAKNELGGGITSY